MGMHQPDCLYTSVGAGGPDTGSKPSIAASRDSASILSCLPSPTLHVDKVTNAHGAVQPAGKAYVTERGEARFCQGHPVATNELHTHNSYACRPEASAQCTL